MICNISFFINISNFDTLILDNIQFIFQNKINYKKEVKNSEK